jgi:hypothetical protein
MKAEYKTTDCGNNEYIGRGVVRNGDGTFTAMTFTNSKDFKTLAGAVKWFKKQTGK